MNEMENHVRTVLLLGRPGSGKGTQTELLAKELGWKTLSSGGIFRELRNSEGPLGEKVRATYDNGLLFPAWFPAYLFQHAVLNMPLDEGMICEGFSRALDEAQLFHEVLEWLGRTYVVFNLAVSEDEVLRRMQSRHEKDPRPDTDTPEKLKKRLDEYNARTEPVLAFFKEKGTLVEIDGEPAPEEVAQDLLARLKPLI